MRNVFGLSLWGCDSQQFEAHQLGLTSASESDVVDVAAREDELADAHAKLQALEAQGQEAHESELRVLEMERDALQKQLDNNQREHDTLRQALTLADDGRQTREARLVELEAALRRAEADTKRLEDEQSTLRQQLEHAAVSPTEDGITREAMLDEIFSAPYEDVERQLLAHALERAAGNKSQAARSLGLKRGTFIHKLNKYNLG